jgi:hypothetical protein
MIYDAIKRRDNLIAGQVDSMRFMAESTNRQHINLIQWLRWQVEKREMRLETIGLIEQAGCEPLRTQSAKTAGEVAAFQAVLAYIKNGWQERRDTP